MIPFATDRGAFLTGAWKWWIVPPGLCVAIVVCSFAFVGLGLEERVDAASPEPPRVGLCHVRSLVRPAARMALR